MAGSVNKVIILGRLGQNPELKYIPSGQAVCQMSVATSESFKDRNEQMQERTDWHRVQVWGKMAENCAKYLQKGRQVYVEGRLQTRSWDDKEGKKQYVTEIVASQVVFIGSGGHGEGGGDEGRDDSRGAARGGSGGGGGGYGGGRASGPSSQQRKAQSEPAVGEGGGELFDGADDDVPF